MTYPDILRTLHKLVAMPIGEPAPPFLGETQSDVKDAVDSLSYTNVHNLAGLSSMIFQNYEVSARFAMTPAFSLGAVYDYTHVREGMQTGGVAKGDWHEGGGMADYALSKRTDVYALYHQASGAAVPAWIVGTTDASSGNHQFAGRVGLRHRF